MNGQQKDELRIIDKKLIEIRKGLSKIISEEQAKFDKMGFGLQESSTGADINMGINKLDSMIAHIDHIIDINGEII